MASSLYDMTDGTPDYFKGRKGLFSFINQL